MDSSLVQSALEALLILFSWQHFIHLLVGVFIGLVVGFIPGLGGIAGMALTLPFVFGMEPASALAMMIGLTAVTTTSDTFMAVLLGIPGSSSAQASVMDGFPLAKQGQAARALSAAFSASLIGGLIGAAILTLAFFAAKPILLAIGFGEQLMLVVFALTLVGMLTGKSVIKGLGGCALGLLLGTIGTAPATGAYRFTLDWLYLSDGLSLILVALGVFAIPEIVDVLKNRSSIAGETVVGRGWFRGIRDSYTNIWLVVRCSVIGAMVGFLPGLGGSVVDWIAYGHAMQTTKNRENFGKGEIRGLIGPEAAANAKEGGALIPTLFFGIPGSGSMALLLGGLVIIGLTPGRSMVSENADMIYLIIWSIAIANVLGTGISMAVTKPVSKLTQMNFRVIAPIVLVAVFFSAYQNSGNWGDILILIVFGCAGILLKRFGWSRAALLIGFVLSSNLEAAVYRTVQVYGWSVFHRPLTLVILCFAIMSLIIAFRNRTRPSKASQIEYTGGLKTLPAQILLTSGLLALTLAILADVADLRFLSMVFPVTVATITGVILVVAIVQMARKSNAPGLIYDEDAEGADFKGTLNCLGWVLLLPAVSWLVGYQFGAPVFVFAFLSIFAKITLHRSLIGAAVIAVIVYVVTAVLGMEVPNGLLNPVISNALGSLMLADHGGAAPIPSI
ncbi:TctA family transporter [Paracoccus saliphilus]|uniref:TctA family transporter n=2 Tax=Paracoccus saliphilus TaxID=405559 RepID=A0AA46A7E7_9RHOB|nr:tripartite tricarboxylate transporter permease [Paracoccus saliphilus]SIT12528.1 TctA family transporter [Paracoccus saliphilus]